jgi:hypothetical protein
VTARKSGRSPGRWRWDRAPATTVHVEWRGRRYDEAVIDAHLRLTGDDIRAAQAVTADYLADEALVYG